MFGWSISTASGAVGVVLFALVAVGRVAGQVPPTSTPTPQPGPAAAFLTHWIAETNAGDIEGALALVTDDVTLLGGPPCNVNPCVGKESIQARLQVAVGNRTQYRLTSVSVEGKVAKARAEQTNNAVRACGLQRFIANIEVEMRGFLISRLSLLNDLSDPETLAFQACIAAGGAAGPVSTQPVRPPPTGDAGLVDRSP
jgi:hypothetical protein